MEIDSATITRTLVGIGGAIVVLMQAYTSSQIPGIERQQDAIQVSQHSLEEQMLRVQERQTSYVEQILALSGSNQKTMIEAQEAIKEMLTQSAPNQKEMIDTQEAIKEAAERAVKDLDEIEATMNIVTQGSTPSSQRQHSR